VQNIERIVSGCITSVRQAEGADSLLEIEISPSPDGSNARTTPVWCSAPTVSENGVPIALSENHLAAARKYFVGRPAEVEIDPDGTIRGQLLWKRNGES
jgi:hypothetical protein